VVPCPVTAGFVQGDFVGGGRDGAQANLDVTGDGTRLTFVDILGKLDLKPSFCIRCSSHGSDRRDSQDGRTTRELPLTSACERPGFALPRKPLTSANPFICSLMSPCTTRYLFPGQMFDVPTARPRQGATDHELSLR
jgi:hypothetical protein